MHVEILRIFCDLADLQSFSKTAEKHFLSQSAVSQQLAQLELTHKCQLINRKKKPFELTKEGKLLYQAAKDMLNRYEKFKVDLATLKSSATAKLNVAAIFSIGMHTLPDYVKTFMVKYPDGYVDSPFIIDNNELHGFKNLSSNEPFTFLCIVPRKRGSTNPYEISEVK